MKKTKKSLHLHLTIQYAKKGFRYNQNHICNKPEAAISPNDTTEHLSSKSFKDKNYNVLIAEDDEATGYMLCEYLNRFDLSTDWVLNGQIAYERALQFDYQIILSDDHMPIMNGIDLIKKLRTHEKYSKTPIIVLTGSSFGESYDLLKSISATQILFKPYSLSELKDTIYSLLA